MTIATLSSLQTSKAQSLLRRKIWMLISETTKMTSSAKPKNPCQSNPAEDCLNYSTQIPTGWNYNIPPKYMIYKCTLAVRNLKSLFTIRVILPLQNHSHYRRSHHRNQHHILLEILLTARNILIINTNWNDKMKKETNQEQQNQETPK